MKVYEAMVDGGILLLECDFDSNFQSSNYQALGVKLHVVSK